MLAVTLKTNGKILGMVGIGNKEEIDSLRLNYLIAIVETENFPSQRVIEKSGFTKLETRMILNSGETEEQPFYYYRLYNPII